MSPTSPASEHFRRQMPAAGPGAAVHVRSPRSQPLPGHRVPLSPPGRSRCSWASSRSGRISGGRSIGVPGVFETKWDPLPREIIRKSTELSFLFFSLFPVLPFEVSYQREISRRRKGKTLSLWLLGLPVAWWLGRGSWNSDGNEHSLCHWDCQGEEMRASDSGIFSQHLPGSLSLLKGSATK